MIINGKQISNEIKEELKNKILKLSVKKPLLSVVLVGNDLSSITYVRVKKRACESIGMDFKLYQYSEDEKEEVILKKIEELNNDKNVNGILVQMPLPLHINSFKVIESINPDKDVDGFHPVNVGKMLIGNESGFLPCTPLGIKILLQKSFIEVESKHVVIVGRSNIVGKPLAAILIQKKIGCNATVTITHSYSKNLKELTRQADILVAAIGKANFITKDMVRYGAVVIDVGMNYLKQTDGTTKLVGDVDFEKVFKIASHITPVPGGVGPMTVAMLLQNTFNSFYKSNLWKKK
jgi:methylenetetrahydrofolate dehydrogenase (NADP+) / methenyltetrahydrofolate cyclohydrolase